MKKCSRCNKSSLVVDSRHNFHNIYKCLICNKLTPFRIDECCRNSYLYIAIDDEIQNRRRLHRQCLNCGGCMDRTKPLSFKIYFSEIRYEFNHDLYGKWIKECHFEFANLWESVKDANYDTSKFAIYNTYINSENWRFKRNQVFLRDKHLCQVCENAAEEVHHISYENLGDEKLDELISVCKKCHREIHLEQDKKELDDLKNIKNDNNKI